MFRTTITTNAMVNDIANDFFRNIYGDPYNNDISFISTLRALVAPRIGEDEKLSVRFYRSSYSAEAIGSSSYSVSTVRAICDYFNPSETGSIYVHSFESIKESDNQACIELMLKKFCQAYKGWHRLEKITEFYYKQFSTVCFINPECKSVAIFIERMDMRKMHYLQCSIFAFLPWYFDPQKGVTEVEMELISSLREKTSDKYLSVLTKIASQYDFRATRIKRMLSGFETRYEKVECDNVRRQISRIQSDINSLNNRIGEQLRTKNELNIKLLGLERKIQLGEEDSEMMDYFLCNHSLIPLCTYDSELTFGVITYLEYFDEDMAIAAINNNNSYLYIPGDDDGCRYIPVESMKKLMKAIFIDQILKIKVCAAYRLRLDGDVEGLQRYSFGHEFYDCMPNPHIDGYSCLGNYQTTINTLLSDRNYIGAVEQCIASAKSLNFGDSTVMRFFAKTIHKAHDGYNNVCIELPDGRVVDPTEAIAWIEKQESGEDE